MLEEADGIRTKGRDGSSRGYAISIPTKTWWGRVGSGGEQCCSTQEVVILVEKPPARSINHYGTCSIIEEVVVKVSILLHNFQGTATKIIVFKELCNALTVPTMAEKIMIA